MPKPSILQTLLSKPSRSYANSIYSEDDFHSIHSNSNQYSSNSLDGDSRSRRSRKDSNKSNASIKSSNSSNSRNRNSISEQQQMNYPSTSSGNNTNWEWSIFGARRNLTSIRGTSEIDEREFKSREDFERRSLRSFKSNDSIGTTTSSEKSKRRKKKGVSYNESLRADGGYVGEYVRSGLGLNESNSGTSIDNYVPIASTSTLPYSNQSNSDSIPSRRYSTLPYSNSNSTNSNSNYYQSTPTISITASSPIPLKPIPLEYQDPHPDSDSDFLPSIPNTSSQLQQLTSSNSISSGSNMKVRPIITPLNLLQSDILPSPSSHSTIPLIPIPTLVNSPRNKNFSFMLESTIAEEEEEEEEEYHTPVIGYQENEDRDISVNNANNYSRTSEESSRPDSIYFDTFSTFYLQSSSQPPSRNNSISNRAKKLLETNEIHVVSRSSSRSSSNRPESIYFEIEDPDLVESDSDDFKIRPQSVYYDAEFSIEEEEEVQVVDKNIAIPISSLIKSVDSITPLVHRSSSSTPIANANSVTPTPIQVVPGKIYTIDEIFSSTKPLLPSPSISTKASLSSSPPIVPARRLSPKKRITPPPPSSTSNNTTPLSSPPNSLVMSNLSSSSNSTSRSSTLGFKSSAMNSKSFGSGYTSPASSENENEIEFGSTGSSIAFNSNYRKGARNNSVIIDENEMNGIKVINNGTRKSEDSGQSSENGLGNRTWTRAILVPRPLSMNGNGNNNVLMNSNSNYKLVKKNSNPSISNSRSQSNLSTSPTIQIVASSSTASIQPKSSILLNNSKSSSTSPPSTLPYLGTNKMSSPPNQVETFSNPPTSVSTYSNSNSNSINRRDSGISLNGSGYNSSRGVGGGTIQRRLSVNYVPMEFPIQEVTPLQAEEAYTGIVVEKINNTRISSTATISNQLNRQSLISLASTTNTNATSTDSRKLSVSRATTSVYSNSSSIGEKSTNTNRSSAPIRPSRNPKRFLSLVSTNTKLDHLNDGMKAIMITSNVNDSNYNTASSSNSLSKVFKRKSRSSSMDFSNSSSNLPNHLQNLYQPQPQFNPMNHLTFTSISSPPNQLKVDEVLIAVLACSLDNLDFELVKWNCTRIDKGGLGWIPGRSFCGKIVETGFEVVKFKRGDVVFGVCDIRKCGALAELMTIKKDLITLAPNCGLLPEEIAILPSAGIFAVQIMQTLCQYQPLPKGSKILILNAHESVGNLCMQLAFYFRTTRDLWIVAHCPNSNSINTNYLRETGASDILEGNSLDCINSLDEESFDVVIDTIGGSQIFEASRRILHTKGRFYTTIGDALTPSTTTNSLSYKSSMKSLRHSFFSSSSSPSSNSNNSKSPKSIDYWNLSLDENTREDRKIALEILREAVEIRGIRGTIERVYEFEFGREAFERFEGEGRVVRVVKV